MSNLEGFDDDADELDLETADRDDDDDTGDDDGIEGEGDATKAFIAFDKSGNKPLLLKYAKLTII